MRATLRPGVVGYAFQLKLRELRCLAEAQEREATAGLKALETKLLRAEQLQRKLEQALGGFAPVMSEEQPLLDQADGARVLCGEVRKGLGNLAEEVRLLIRERGRSREGAACECLKQDVRWGQ